MIAKDKRPLNPLFPGNTKKGHRQTVQIQPQTPNNVASDQGLYCLLTGFSMKGRIKAIK